MELLKLNANKKEREIICNKIDQTPSYCKDTERMVEHISKNLARIFLSTNRNKIDQILKEMKMGK